MGSPRIEHSVEHGAAGAPTDDAAVQAFLSTNKAATTSADHAGAGFTSIADCPNAP